MTNCYDYQSHADRRWRLALRAYYRAGIGQTASQLLTP
jgi:hypothetical protein